MIPNNISIDRSETESGDKARRILVFSLIYLTFFLDNVLLTILVPIIPDWVRGESLALWAHTSPAVSLAGLLNRTQYNHSNFIDSSTVLSSPSSLSGAQEQIVVGIILGVKAISQLIMAPVASVCVARFGPCLVLRLSTATLATAALMFGVSACWSGRGSVWCVGFGRAAHGAGSAMAGVAGLALAAAALTPEQRDRALGALLGAVALGVLVGYPFGGTAYALWSREAPFLLVAAALFIDLAIQLFFIDNNNYMNTISEEQVHLCEGLTSIRDVARGVAGASAGAVLLTTSVMASLEPCLPLWLLETFQPKKWQLGAVFIPDSAGYLVAASLLGGWSRRLGAERVAITGVLAVGFAAILVPLAKSVSALAWPHAMLGVGLGGTDAALVPALLARQPHKVHHLAALLQAASSAAYAIGPVCGGLISAWLGFPTTMRILGVSNLLYAGFLYKALRENPLSEQWGAKNLEDASFTSSESMLLQPRQYRALRNATME